MWITWIYTFFFSLSLSPKKSSTKTEARCNVLFYMFYHLREKSQKLYWISWLFLFLKKKKHEKKKIYFFIYSNGSNIYRKRKKNLIYITYILNSLLIDLKIRKSKSIKTTCKWIVKGEKKETEKSIRNK